MKPELQRIAIAEACGWNPSPICKGKWCHDSNMPMAKNGAYSVWVGRESLPNYLSDLNAMHEAEKSLTVMQWPNYVTCLCGLTRDRNGEGLVFATAAQRAEAFLLTLNLWQE